MVKINNNKAKPKTVSKANKVPNRTTQQGQQLDNQDQNGDVDNDGDGIPDDLDN